MSAPLADVCQECEGSRENGSCDCGCWHYDYEAFCVMHDPETYEPSDDDEGGEA